MEDKTQSTPKKQYICDPNANISCDRQACVLMGGTCFTTPNQEFATSGPNGLPEEATPRKALEMKSLISEISKDEERPAIHHPYALRCAMCGKEIDSIPNLIAMPHEDHMRNIGLISPSFSDSSVSIIDTETTKIRKHTHDTLWAVMLGFGACAGLVVVIGMIIIGVLSYARG